MLDNLSTVVADNTFVWAPHYNTRPGVYRGPKGGVEILVREGVTDKFVAGVEVHVTRSRRKRVRNT